MESSYGEGGEVLDSVVLLARSGEVVPELPPESLEVFSAGTRHRGWDLHLLFAHKVIRIVHGLVVVLCLSSVPQLKLSY